MNYSKCGRGIAMKIWINKQSKESPTEDYNESYIFNVLEKRNESNVTTDVEELWQDIGINNLDNIYEDLLIIGISLFCADKRVLRSFFDDSWTRYIEINIPVLEISKWNSVKKDMEQMLGFLSGDIWIIQFRRSNLRLRTNDKKNDSEILMNSFDAVSLFSGGLDSFCGALKLMKEGINTCFVGFREYNSVSQRQNDLYKAIDKHYPEVEKSLMLFGVSPKTPKDINDDNIYTRVESTSRSRSFLFLAGAVAIASTISKDIPVYIPENGFIGVNVPLTDSRNGSCSTRTTHAYFIKDFNDMLQKVGINNKVLNFYAFKSKGEIVQEHKDNPVFIENASKTISCSHPCHARYSGYTNPLNCGYCYPCLIRKASLNSIGYADDNYNPDYTLNKNFIDEFNKINGKASDLKAVLLSLKRYLIHKDDENYIRHILLKHGQINKEELKKYEVVYRKSMEELLQMFIEEDKRNHGGLLDYLGYKQ